MSEAAGLAKEKVAQLHGLSIEELAKLDSEEHVASESGRKYRVKAYSFWDMDEWGSDLLVHVKVYGSSLLARVRPDASAVFLIHPDGTPTPPRVRSRG